MFTPVCLQIAIPFLFGEYQLLPLDQDPLSTILATEIDKQIGGKVYENHLIRKGAKHITVKSYDCPEAVDNEIVFTVQFETFGFFPLCSDDVVYQMKVVDQYKEQREVKCEWPDPVTGVCSAVVLVEVPAEEEELPVVHSLIHVRLTDFKFEFDAEVVKCIGTMVSCPL